MELGANPWPALSHIMDPLNIPDEMAQSKTQEKLILLLSLDISQTVSEKGKDEIRKTYPSGRKYLAFRETKEGRLDSNTFVLSRAVANSWEMPKRFSLLLIKIRIRKDQKQK